MSFQKQIVQSLLWRGSYFTSILVLNIFLSRYLGAAQTGWIFYISTNFSFILILAGLTIENAVNYYASNKEIEQEKLAWFSLLWSVMVGVAALIFLWIFYQNLTGAPYADKTRYVLYGVSYVAGIQLTNFFTVLFYAKKKFVLPNVLMAALNVVFILLIAFQHASTRATLITPLYFSLFAGTGIVLAAAFKWSANSWRKIVFPSRLQVKLLVRYAMLALTANVIFFLVYRVDYWFVERYCSAAALGNYIQVSKLGQMLLIFPTIISGVVFPHTAGGMERVEMKDNILRIGRFTTLLYLLFFVVVAVSGKWLFPVVFGPTYNMMYLPFLVLLPGIWALSNLFVLSAYFGGTNQVKTNITGAAIGLVIILLGDVLFIKTYGIVAAAIISTAGYLANFGYAFYRIQKEHPVSIKEYWKINKEDFKWISAALQR